MTSCIFKCPVRFEKLTDLIQNLCNKEFEKGERNDEMDEDEGGWATMHGEVDYSEKLVFSDDEESNAASRRFVFSSFSQKYYIICFVVLKIF